MLQVFTPSGILAVVNELEGERTVHVCFQILQPLAEVLPADIIAYDDKIIAAIRRLKGMGTSGTAVLVVLSKRSEVRELAAFAQTLVVLNKSTLI